MDNGWNADRIGVMVVDAPGTTTTMGGKYKNVGYATTSTGTNADFTPMTAGGGIFFEDAFLEFTFAAYAPYASGANASTLPGTDGKITVNTSNQPTTTEQEKVDYIHATGAKVDKDSPTVSFTDNTAAGGSDCSFKHKMVRLILKVQVSNTDGFDDTAVLEFADYKLGDSGSRGNVRCEDRYRRDRGQRCERLDVTPVHRCPEDYHGQVRGNL
ncbi:fimbrillin family protein [Bacteroides ovatus]|nr:fimbrillin family protein [Bacteroides ovatus]